jgi:predicted permease
VVSEVALAVVLLTGAGLMLQSVWRLANLDPGFRREQVLTAEISFAGERYATVEQQYHLLSGLQQRIAALPGVEAAALVNHLPIGGDMWRFQFVVDGQPAPASDQMPLAAYRAATPGLFRALGIRLVRGRDFSASDTPNSEPVILVNETAARRYFGGEDPVGKRIRLGALDSDLPWLKVIGVTSDVRQGALAQEVPPEMYLPYSQQLTEFFRNSTLVVHTRGETAPLERAIQRATWDLDASLPVTRIRKIEQILEGEVRQPRRQGLLIAAFAGVALLLAGIGLYGVVSYLVARRTQEIGVRMALGAQRGDILRLVLGQGMGLVVVGVGIGLAGAWMLTRWIASLLFDVSPTDPATFAAVSGLLGLVAMLACYLPARRAAQVDPMAALRQE